MIERSDMRALAALALDAGLGVGPGTRLRLAGEPPLRELMLVIAEEAYARGAALVRIDYDDVRLARIRVDHSAEEVLDAVPEVLRAESDVYARERWSYMRIAGYEDAAAMEGADHARLTRLQRARSAAAKNLREAQMASRIAWCIVPFPTPAWARTVLGASGTEEQLWKKLVPILRLDAPDPAVALRRDMDALTARGRVMDSLGLRWLHFQGPGTDLRVAVSPESRWLGGGDTTPDGRAFMANIPSEEIFTTPDFRGTEGTIATTRRARIHGTVVEGATLTFRRGEVTACSAVRGAGALESFLETDLGARRLGEVALVDSSSPIWQSGLVFDSMLLDENAACHVALGAGYDLAMQGVEGLDDAAKAARGFNTSIVHEDLMVGSDEVSVSGEDGAGKSVPVIVRGRFVIKG